MGIKSLKNRDSIEINKFYTENVFISGVKLMQSNNYYSYFDLKDSLMKAIDSNANDSFKAFIQPLQALYFDSAGNLESVLINCYAVPNGFNLNWNTENRLDFFPPKTHTNLFKKLRIEEILLQTNINMASIDLESKKNKVLIFWNIFLGKQTEIFLNAIQNNILKSKDKPIVYFINNDNSLFTN